MRNSLVIGALVGALAVVGACTQVDEAANEQIRQTRELTAQAQSQVGMPGIVNFTERKLLRKLYELRDQEISTYTYVRDFEGRLWHLCDSIGYGIPFSAQFSNPEGPMGLKTRSSQADADIYVLPLPEPNGLYPPTNSSATWVICADPDGGQFRPVYEEGQLTVSPFPLKAWGSYFEEKQPTVPEDLESRRTTP